MSVFLTYNVWLGAMFRSHFWQLRCLQKLPKLATLPRKFCCFWQPLCNARFFYPILAIHKIAKIGKTCLLKVAQNGNFGCYYRFAIIGNICSSSKSSQMTTALPYIPSGSIGKDLYIYAFLATLLVATFGNFLPPFFKNIGYNTLVHYCFCVHFIT